MYVNNTDIDNICKNNKYDGIQVRSIPALRSTSITENPSGYRQKLLNQGHMEPSVLINCLRWIIVILFFIVHNTVIHIYIFMNEEY